MVRGIKSSEGIIVVSVLLVWAARYLGLDLSVDQVQSGAVEVAKQLHEMQANGPDNAGVWLAAVYTIGRTVIKIIDNGKT